MKDEIKKLIEAALTDGVLTAKEREVILKKAVALGEDPDEIDIYLDAEVQKVEQKSDAAIRQAKGKACPYCGGPIPLLTDKCPHCGQFITAQASEELQEILEGLEDALVDLKSGKNVERSKALVEKHSRKANLYYHNNPKIQLLLREIGEEKAKAVNEAKKDAVKKRILSILKNWKIMIWLVPLSILLILNSIDIVIHSNPSTDEDACALAIQKSLKKNDVDKAYDYYLNYMGDKVLYRRYYKTLDQLAMDLYDKGDYDNALQLVKTIHEEKYDYDNRSLRLLIQASYIKGNNFEKAESCINYHPWDRAFGPYEEFLCKCIDQMKESGISSSEIKKFILRKVKSFYVEGKDSTKEFKSDTVEKRLMKYADIE